MDLRKRVNPAGPSRAGPPPAACGPPSCGPGCRGCIYIYIYIYREREIDRERERDRRKTKIITLQEPVMFGWHYLSHATCLIRPRLLSTALPVQYG